MCPTQFETGVCHQQGDLREDCLCTWRTAQRWVAYMHALSECVCVCVYTLTWPCVCFSGHVPWPVLPLRRGGAERSVFITRGKLRKELRRLLIEFWELLCSSPSFFPSPPHALTYICQPSRSRLWINIIQNNHDDCINDWCYKIITLVL